MYIQFTFAYSEDGFNGKLDRFVPEIVSFLITMAHWHNLFFDNRDFHYPITDHMRPDCCCML